MPRMTIEECRNDWRRTASDIREITDRIASLTTKLLTATMDHEMVPQEHKAILSLLHQLNTAEIALFPL